MKVLVTFGSKLGGTAGIAERIASILRERGHEVDLASGREVRDVRPYDAVVVGGALYAANWQRDARMFVLRHGEALRDREVCFFSSGPLDDSASRSEIPPTRSVKELMDYVGAREHVTFGGRLEPGAPFPGSAMAKTNAGDWRDWARIEAWARHVDDALRAPAAPRPAVRPLPSRTLPLALSALVGVSAVVGGALLAIDPDGSLLGMSPRLLASSPFESFLVPGLLLAIFVGLPSLWAAKLHYERADYAAFASLSTGVVLTIWIVIQMAMLQLVVPLQIVMLAIGLALVADAIVRIRTTVAGWRELAEREKARKGEPRPA